MQRSAILFLLISTALLAFAQGPAADMVQTPKGELTIQPIKHAAIVFRWINKTIYVDPYGGAKAYKGVPPPDLILITDIHEDHLDMETINAIETNMATFIVPQAVADKLPDNLRKKCVIIKNNDTITQKEIAIIALPMYNLPESPESFHTKGRGNGYLLNFGGIRVYISGDTEDIDEMKNLKNINVAFICMNLPYTMTVQQAADATLMFKPAIVYPYHYRGKDDMSNVEEYKKLVNEGNKSIDVRLRNWYVEY